MSKTKKWKNFAKVLILKPQKNEPLWKWGSQGLAVILASHLEIVRFHISCFHSVQHCVNNDQKKVYLDIQEMCVFMLVAIKMKDVKELFGNSQKSNFVGWKWKTNLLEVYTFQRLLGKFQNNENKGSKKKS